MFGSKLKIWFPVLLYSGIIFCVSSVPSDRLVFLHLFWDKVLHTIEYVPLGFLWARALRHTGFPLGFFLWLASTLFCYLYGLSDEFHQSFTPGRESCLSDTVADLVGGGLGAGIYLIIKQILKDKKEDQDYVSA